MTAEGAWALTARNLDHRRRADGLRHPLGHLDGIVDDGGLVAGELGDRPPRHVGVAPPGPSAEPAEPLRPEFFGQAVLATWRQLLDEYDAGIFVDTSDEKAPAEALRSLLAAPPDLPVTAGLAPLVEALHRHRVAVVQAPTSQPTATPVRATWPRPSPSRLRRRCTM